MKIKQELLETLIRVCAKEVLTQLNEGKSKKCKKNTGSYCSTNTK